MKRRDEGTTLSAFVVRNSHSPSYCTFLLCFAHVSSNGALKLVLQIGVSCLQYGAKEKVALVPSSSCAKSGTNRKWTRIGASSAV